MIYYIRNVLFLLREDMVERKDFIGLSKFLSLVLRHRPDIIGLKLDQNGWADVAALLDGCRKTGRNVDMRELREIVRSNDKKRFSFSGDGSRIRANQGHTVPVDLQLEERKPPEVLYHGTAPRFVSSIKSGGLKKGARHHVHLSRDPVTAGRVGARRGSPVVFTVKAGEMQRMGFRFFVSENDVWLTDYVPPRYLVIDGVHCVEK